MSGAQMVPEASDSESPGLCLDALHALEWSAVVHGVAGNTNLQCLR